MKLDQYSFEDPPEAQRLREAWGRVLARISEEGVTETVYRRFLATLCPHGLQNGRAVVNAPGQFVQEYVTDRFADRLQAYLEDELGEPVRLEVRGTPQERPKGTVPREKIPAIPAVVETTPFTPLPKYRFDTFIAGQSNRLALAGAKAVAAAPGTKYNPLFIYGSSGLGKTHLLHAIAQELLSRNASYPLHYITAQAFTEEFVYALQNNRMDKFRSMHRGVRVWLLDDVQFIAGKDKTQEEVFHTFNSLQSEGRQVVLCSDKPPRDLLLMDERLRSRFESGLVVDIQMPDTETRCAILQSKAAQLEIRIDHQVAMYLAQNVPGNVRILEGALTRLAAQSSLLGHGVELESAQEMVERYYRATTVVKPSFDQILHIVSRHTNIPVSDIQGTSRKAPIAMARHMAVYVTREITNDSWKHIGSLFGNKDHTSMLHANKKVREMMNRDKDLNASVRSMICDLYPEGLS